MKMQLDWGDIEQTYIVWNFEHGWTWEECIASSCELRDMVAEKANDVNVILDLRDSHQPFGMTEHLPELQANLPHNINMAIVIAERGLVYGMYKFIDSLDREIAAHIRFVRTVDEAYHMLMATV